MKVLFVCTGNTCRSPLAEVIFNNKKNKDDMKAYSAGISIVPGSTASNNSSYIALEALEADIRGRKAVQLTSSILEEMDIILTMTAYIKEAILNRFPELKNKVFSLKEYVGVKGDVMDPYGGSISFYRETYTELENLIDELLVKIEGDSKL